MSMKRHRTIGIVPVSPRERLMRTIEAQKSESAKPRRKSRWYSSVADLMRKERS